MTKLKEMFLSHTGRYTCKFPHYMDIYDEWFSPFVDKEVTVLEVGSGIGGFLQLCKKFLGKKAKIYGLETRKEFFFEEPQIKMFLGEQQDKVFLKKVAEEIGTIDILVDDASHYRDNQISTIEIFLPYLNEQNSLYFIEDLNISYYPYPAYSNPSFIDYLKKIVDKINTNNATPTYNSIHFYTYLAILNRSLEPSAHSSPVGVGHGYEYYRDGGV